jgi:hypothetical protein
VADGSSGLHVLDVSNPASPTLTFSYDTPGVANDASVSGTVAYVADGASGGLQLINVGTPAAPTLLGSYDTPGDARGGLVVSGTVAYVTDNSAGLQVLNVSNPASPTLLGTYNTPGFCLDVAVSGTVAYVADDISGLQILNVSNPASPTLLGSYDTPGNARGVVVSGTVAYVADGASGLQILNVSNPASPTLLGTYDTPGAAKSVAVSGTVAYVADFNSGLLILNVSNPASPTLLGTYDTPGYAYDVEVSGTVAYVADDFAGLQILNVSNPASPSLLGTFDTPGFANSVTVSGTAAYVTDLASGLQVLNVDNPAIPTLLGSYSTPNNAWDVEVSGTMAYVAGDVSGLQILEVMQNRLDITRNVGRSIAIDATADAILRARLRSTQVNGVAWELSANGGASWQAAVPGGDWVALTPGSDLRWRGTLSLATTAAPEASRVELDWLYAFPVVKSVADIANDQGRQARLTWTRSNSDFVGASPQITEYAIYRRIESGLAPLGVAAATGHRTGDAEIAAALAEGWDYVATAPAEAEDFYSMVVPTLADSTIAGGQHWSAFRVRARTATPGVYYDSYPDSGYSTDNLAPNVPSGLLVSYQIGSGSHLAWDDPVDGDFRYFKIYRSTNSGFIPGPANLLHSTTATAWTDASFSGGTAYYKLSAVDFSGNESGTASTTTTTGIGDPPALLRFALHAAMPNPFGLSTTIRYDVPALGGAVRLSIHDVGGRLVRSLVDDVEAPGAKSITWDGRDRSGRMLPAGIYLVRMQAADFVQMRKLVLSR